MKTIEEKAKAYDEALEDMRVIYPNLKGDAKLAVEHAFPQLRESEDERIRKILIDAFEKKNNSFIDELVDCRLTKADILAWFEKQKEQKPTSFNEPYNPDEYEVVMEGNATSLKRKEQKQDVHQINMTIHLGPNIPSCPNPVIAEVKELESNDKYIKRNSKELGSLLTQYYDEGFWKGRKAERESQKPAEWSEEDETRRTNVIILLQTPILRKVYQQSEIDKAVEWLRNLRPQPHWKPSEEQIRALRRTLLLANFGLEKDRRDTMSSLYNDLLKLK